MSAFVKKYPRARIAPHPNLNGWTVDILMGAKARPSRIKATYATIPFAAKAAHAKLGVPQAPAEAPSAAPTAEPAAAPQEAATPDAGTCHVCNRPMRFQRTKVADFPGTVARRREGICMSCALKAEREQEQAA